MIQLLYLLMAIFSTVLAFAEGPDALQTLQTLHGRVSCQQGFSPASCTRLTALTASRPFFLVNRLGAEGKRTSKADPEMVRKYQDIFRQMDARRGQLLNEFKQFSTVYFQELKAKSETQEAALRPWGGPKNRTLFGYFSLVREELRAKIPNNFFFQGFEHRSGSYSINAAIKTELEKVGQSFFPSQQQKFLRPIVGTTAEVTSSQAFAALGKIKNALFPNLPLLRMSKMDSISRKHLAEDVRSYRSFRQAFPQLNPENAHGARPGYGGPFRLISGAAFSSVAGFGIAATNIGLSTQALTDCSVKFAVPLGRNESLELAAISYVKNGLKQTPSCDQLVFDPEGLKALMHSETKLTPLIQSFLLKYEALLEKQEDPSLWTEAGQGFAWECPGRMSFGQSEAIFQNSQLSIRTSTKIDIRLPMDSAQRWQYKLIRSSDPNLSQHLFDKFNSAMVSPSAARDQLKPEWACGPTQRNTLRYGEELCEASRFIQAWNEIGNICSLSEAWSD